MQMTHTSTCMEIHTECSSHCFMQMTHTHTHTHLNMFRETLKILLTLPYADDTHTHTHTHRHTHKTHTHTDVSFLEYNESICVYMRSEEHTSELQSHLNLLCR